MKNKYTNLILVSLILIFSVLFYKDPFESKSEANPVTSDQEISEFNKDPVVEEVIKDGIYTNYKYGFQFEYNPDYFIYEPYWVEHTQASLEHLILPSPDKDRTGLTIKLLENSSEFADKFLDNCFKVEVGSIITQSTKSGTQTKIDSGSNYCYYYSDPEGLEDGESSYGYGFYLKHNDKYALIYAGSSYKDFANELANKTKQIRESFQFIDKNLYRNEEYGFQFEYPASKFEESNEFNNEHNLKQWTLIQEDDESIYETIILSAVAIEPYEKNSEMSTISTVDNIQRSGYSIGIEKWKTNKNAGTDINIVYLARLKDEDNSIWYEVRLVGSVLKEDLLSELEADFIRIANSFELTD